MTSAYCVFDKKAGAYSTPQFLENDEVAIRAFISTVGTSPLFSDFPEDFALVYIGDFDAKTGDLTPADEQVVIAEAIDCVKKEVNENGED